MAAETEQSTTACGCKGIRSCLKCEDVDGKGELHENGQTICHYLTYDPTLRMAVRDDGQPLFPFHGVFLWDNFVSEEEEMELIRKMDQDIWRESQSGRRKQDFGPKVNFKKRKVRVAGFSGLPDVSHSLVQRMTKQPLLEGFQPVEQCNLDYHPQRGSAIDPHLDDSWLWGERLVTVSLLSDAVLTMSLEEGLAGPGRGEEGLAEPGRGEEGLAGPGRGEEGLAGPGRGEEGLAEPGRGEEGLAGPGRGEEGLAGPGRGEEGLAGPGRGEEGLAEPGRGEEGLAGPGRGEEGLAEPGRGEEGPGRGEEGLEGPGRGEEGLEGPGRGEEGLEGPGQGEEVRVAVHLPRRSLVVLYGEARHRWKHAIRRQDVHARRVCCTFRELSAEFLIGGGQEKLGAQLLNIALSFQGTPI